MLATILWTFVGMALLLLAVFILARGPFLSAMQVAPADRAEFEAAYLVFFIGLAVMFPLGLFPEILRGLQRIDLANWIATFSTVTNFVLLWWGLQAGWPLPTLMMVSVATTAFPGLLAAFIALRMLPGLSLRPRWFDWRTVKAQLGFSIAAYLITFSNMLMSKSDQLVISLTVGVALVAVYQAGFKVSEMLGLFSSQLQQALSPAAAAMHATGDSGGLRQLLLESSRLTFFLVTPCYLLAACYLEPLIRLLTGTDPVPRETYWVGQALLLVIYSSQLTSGCSKRVLMMCGKERKLLVIALVDGLSNLALSIVLAFKLGVLGVALGTLIPTTLVGWLWIVPVTIRHLGITGTSYLANHFRGTLVPLGAFGVVLAVLVFGMPARPDCGLAGLAWRGALCILPLLALGHREIRRITRS